MAVSPPAWADNECGGIVAGSVTCTPAGNDYSSGITYDTVQDLTMVVQDGVTIMAVTGDAIKVSLGGYDLDLRIYDTDVSGDIGAIASGADGIDVRYADSVTILNHADMSASAADARSIFVYFANQVTITNYGNIYDRGIETLDIFGDVTITNHGAIDVEVPEFCPTAQY
jgi:hypothetical protein